MCIRVLEVGQPNTARLEDAARSVSQIRSSYDRQRCPVLLQRSTAAARRVSTFSDTGAAMLLASQHSLVARVVINS